MSSKPVNSRRHKAVREVAVPVEPRGKYGKKHSEATKRMRTLFTKSPSTPKQNKNRVQSGTSTVTNRVGTKGTGNKGAGAKDGTNGMGTSTGTKAGTNSGVQAGTNRGTKGATNKGNRAGKHVGKRIGRSKQTIGKPGRKTVGTRAGAAASQADSAVQAGNPMISEVATEFSGGATDPIDHLSARFQRTLSRVFRKGRALRSDAKPPTVKLIKAICAVIRQGNHVETAVRAFGIRSNVYRQWVDRGFEDIAAGDSTPYALFVAACDAADAQAEALDIMAIRHGIENWQALAWLRERKSFARWGLKSIQLTAGSSEPMASKLEHNKALEPELAANVLVALEEAGIVTVPGREHESGIPEEIIVEGRAQDTATVEQGEEVVAELRD